VPDDVVPAWLDSAIVYAVMPDRFARGALPPGADEGVLSPWDQPAPWRAFLGGTLDGVTRHLDHLQELGITVLDPEVCLIGELWWDSPQWLTGDTWDGVTDYPTMAAIRRFAGGTHNDPRHIITGANEADPLDGPSFAAELGRLLGRYDDRHQRASWVFSGSSDTARFLTVCGDADRAWLATVLVFTLPGTPYLYYGDEVGMEGGLDPDNRRGFPPPPHGVVVLELRA